MRPRQAAHWYSTVLPIPPNPRLPIYSDLHTESATDQDIQMKLRELYSKEDEREKREKVQGSILSEISTVEDQAVLSMAASRVDITNDFRERLVRGILADEDYAAIWTKLQDPNEMNEVTERSRTYRIKRGILKTHEEN